MTQKRFLDLMLPMQPRMQLVAERLLGSATEAEDAVQEALITYYTDSREFKDESQLKYWLIRITVNKAHDLRRRFRGKWDVSWEEYIQSVDFESPKQRSLVTEVLQLFATMSSEEFNNRYRNVQASEIFVSCDYC